MDSQMVLRQNLYLIGDVDIQILGNKLPSILQVLKVFFFHNRVLKSTLRESAANTIAEVKVFWQKAGLPTQRDQRCIEKILNLHKEYRSLQKNKKKESNRQKEQVFMSATENLFDIAHENVFDGISENKKEFLLNQRKNGRVGYIVNIKVECDEEERDDLQKLTQEKLSLVDTVELISSNGSQEHFLSQKMFSFHSNFSDELNVSNSTGIGAEAGPSNPKRARGQINVLNDELVAILDRCEISDRNAVYLISTIATALGFDAHSLILNKSSIRRHRERMRLKKSEHIKQIFKDIEWKAGVLHWDGKILPSVSNQKLTERLCIVITDNKIEKLLGVPELEDGKGISQANAIFEVLTDWGFLSSIKAICCDTTASNLGHTRGAAVLLEQLLEKDLLYLPCRHHIFELILRAVFEEKIPSTTGPGVPLFKRFQNAWSTIDSNAYNTGIENNDIRHVIANHVEDIEKFVQDQLKSAQPRDDYKELLTLVQIFIGKTPHDGVKFRKPGAFHHARWMSKAVYVLKIFLFRGQFKLTRTEEKSLSDICVFLVLIYIQIWYTCTFAPAAPRSDLQLVKKLSDYKLIDKKISEVTLKKFRNHLWYLNPETAAMAFFDETLCNDMKRRMVSKLSIIDDDTDCPKRLIVCEIESLNNLTVDSLISSKSRKFFERFQINENFLKIDPTQWPQNNDYNSGLQLIKNLNVVNDTAERAVKLIEDYNQILSKDHAQKQFILQIVSENRKTFPDARKRTVLRNS